MTPLMKLMKNPKFHDEFCKLGKSLHVSPHVYEDLEAFACLMGMYGYATGRLIP